MVVSKILKTEHQRGLSGEKSFSNSSWLLSIRDQVFDEIDDFKEVIEVFFL